MFLIAWIVGREFVYLRPTNYLSMDWISIILIFLLFWFGISLFLYIIAYIFRR